MTRASRRKSSLLVGKANICGGGMGGTAWVGVTGGETFCSGATGGGMLAIKTSVSGYVGLGVCGSAWDLSPLSSPVRSTEEVRRVPKGSLDGAELVVRRLVGVLGSISFLPPAILPSTFFKRLVGVRSGSGVGEVPSGGLRAAMVGKVEIPSAADAVLWLKYGHPSIYPGW